MKVDVCLCSWLFLLPWSSTQTPNFSASKQLLIFIERFLHPGLPKIIPHHPPPKKHADEITPQIWPTTFWKRRGFPSAWSSRSAAILRAPSQHPWMIEKVGGQQSFRWKLFEGPQLKGNSRGFQGSPKKNCSEEARGACHPFLLGEKVFWTENIF